MNITFWLNGKKKQAEVEPSELLPQEQLLQCETWL